MNNMRLEMEKKGIHRECFKYFINGRILITYYVLTSIKKANYDNCIQYVHVAENIDINNVFVNLFFIKDNKS